MRWENSNFKSLACITILFLALIITSHAFAGTFLGELKWEVKPDEVESSETLFTGITHMGGEYFSIQGYLEPSDGDGIIILGGSGILKGTHFYMNLQHTHTHLDSPYRDAQSWRIKINTSTMSGTFWSLGGSFSSEDKDMSFNDCLEGTIALSQ